MEGTDLQPLTDGLDVRGALLNDIAQGVQEGRWEQTEALCREALAAQGNDPIVLGQLGFSLRRQGRDGEALSAYRSAVALPDVPPELNFNLGMLLLDRGEWSEAGEAFERAVEADAEMVPAMLQSARCAVSQGDFQQARKRFKRLLSVDQKNFNGWLEAGHVFRQLGATQRMMVCYKEAVGIAPQRWEAFLALARAHEDSMAFEAGAAAYYGALGRCGNKRNERIVHWRMGVYRLERGDASRAWEALSCALLCAAMESPYSDENVIAEIRIDLGLALLQLGMAVAANRVFSDAATGTAEATLVRLSDALFRNNMWEQSVEVLRRNVDLHPKSGLAHWNLAHALNSSWQMEEALEELSKAEAIAPMPGAIALRAGIAGHFGDAETALRLYREIAEIGGARSSARSSAAMSTLYSATLSAEEVARVHRELFAPAGVGARAADSFRNSRKVKRRINLGLVTGDLHHQHPVNIFMQPLLNHLDQKKIEVTVYFTGKTHDDQTHLAKTRAAKWVECAYWSNEQLAQRIEADQIDILMDLSGHTASQRSYLFAQRTAPVQVTFLGYPGSTGLPNMDWIIADSVVAPLEHAHLYSEKVARLPYCVFCYAPETDYSYPDYGPEYAERPLTFGSFNNIPKVTPKTVRLWADVLSAVPDSRLMLKAPSFGDAGARRRFVQLFADQGVTENRLEFRGPTELSGMMSEYADIDIALDAVPYNGGTTTLQALWMGVPVIVLEGGNFCSRMGTSFMRAAGMPEWIAKDEGEYVGIARRASSDRQALLNTKRGLREHLLSLPGWNIERYTRDFERALRTMWEEWCKEN